MLNKIDRIIAIIIYSTLPTMIIIMVLTATMFIKQDVQIRKEHAVMKQSLEGFGGISEENPIDVIEDSKQVELWIKNHGIDNYEWIYKDLGLPIKNTKQVYIRYEKGWRWFDKRQCRNLKIKDLSSDGEWDWHNGTDWISKYDLRLYASNSGKAYVGEDAKAGKFICIAGDKYITKYYHLSFQYIKDGDYVEKGTLIGNMGFSGRAVGIHLHFELWIDGKNKNPFSNTTYKKKVVI